MNGFGRGDDAQNKEKNALMTRETVGMTLLLFGAVLFLITVTGPFLFGEVGLAIASFFIGVFGFMCYPLFALLVYLAAVMTFGGKHRLPARVGLRAGLIVLAVFFIVHTATAEKFFGNGYGSYLSGCWSAASERIANGTGGGVLLGLVAYPVRALLSSAGSYIIFSLLLLFAIWLFLRITPIGDKLSFRKGPSPRPSPDGNKEQPETKGERPYPAGVSFDDLPARRRSSEPAQASSERGQRPPVAPVYYPTSEGESASRPAYTQSAPSNREILFGGDPASNYRSNLIYDRDSNFNTRERHSSVEPQYRASAQPRAEQTAEPEGEGGSYTERYTAGTENARPPMPRRVTEEKPRPQSGYAYPVKDDADSNYPLPPSYRAPDRAAPPIADERDYYANDVEFSSGKNVFDEPTSYEEKPKSAEEKPAPRTEPRDFRSTDIFGTDETPARGTEARDFRSSDIFGTEETPARGTETRDFRSSDIFGTDETPTRGTEARDFRTPEPPPAEQDRDEKFRSLFSRPVETRTPFPDETPAEKPETPDEGDGDFGRGSRVFESPMRDSNADLFDADNEDDGYEEEDVPAPSRTRTSTREFRGESRERSSGTRESYSDRETRAEPVPDAPAPSPKPHVYRAYVRPDTGTLNRYEDKKPISQDEIEQNSATIVDTLSAFRVDSEVVKVTCGPAVVRYDIDVPKNISVGAVIKHDEEVAMRLCSKDGVNMYSNREYGVISIEVPKPADKRSIVGLRSVLEADEYVNSKPTALMFGLGKDVEGRSICGNIVKMKHLLVAGSTGSGKSVFLNAMLISLIAKYSPEDLRLILIDPKKVEFAVFEGLPHLMINEIITDPQKAIMALNWAIKEMERRYLLFEQKGKAARAAIRDIDGYNANREADEEKMPRIVIVFDELADLMTVAKKEVEERVARLAAKARAAGIHLVLATQRPSVDVITGVIKGNLPTRIAFRVIAEVDSRTILDETGAQKLLGNGDMLYRSEGMPACMRVQGAFIADGEVQAIVNDIRDNNEAYFDDSVADFINKSSAAAGGGDEGGGGEEGATEEAIRALGIVVKLGQASISLIQRKCSVGYAHAGKIIEWMEQMGYITPFDGTSKARQVILTKEEYESKYGNLD